MSTTDTTTTTRPEQRLQEPGDHERFSHYVTKRDLEAAVLTGTPATALCGKKWLPERDPKSFPVCPDCKTAWEAKDDE